MTDRALPAVALAGGGTALGALVGIPGGPMGVVVGAILGLLIGTGVAAALRLPRRGSGVTAQRIDPFTVGEPWRRIAQDALRSAKQFAEVVAGVPDGPVRDRLASLGDRAATTVDEMWNAARTGNDLSKAYRKLDPEVARRRLATSEASRTEGSDDPTTAALRSKVEAAHRIDAAIEKTRTRLVTLQVRLEETVVRGIELVSGGAGADAFDELDSQITSISDELEALRQAIDETSTAPSTRPASVRLDSDDGTPQAQQQ